MRRARRSKRRPVVNTPQEPERSNRGFEFLGDPYTDVWWADLPRDELAEIWAKVRDVFLAEYWTLEHPGTRPWYWWLHDATEPRKACHRLYTDWKTQLWKEMWRFGSDIEYNGGQAHLGWIMETQTDYLDRCDLLTDYERETLGRPKQPG